MIIDRPICVVGHAKGGTALLTGLINWHSEVGPKPPCMTHFDNIEDFLKSLKSGPGGPSDNHGWYSHYIEHNRRGTRPLVWVTYRENIEQAELTEMVRELPSEEVLDKVRTGLTQDFKEKRLIFKGPSLSFYVDMLPKMLPGIKIVAITRDYASCLASWGRTGPHINSTPEEVNKYREHWEMVNECLGVTKTPIHRVNFDRLLANPLDSMSDIFEYCELPYEPYIEKVLK